MPVAYVPTVQQSDWSAALQDGELKEHADADRNADLRLKKVWNMMLVKPKQRTDPKYKFSFELISPSGEVDVFQAETDEAMMHWLQVWFVEPQSSKAEAAEPRLIPCLSET